MSYLWGRLLRRRDFCIIGMLLIVWYKRANGFGKFLI